MDAVMTRSSMFWYNTKPPPDILSKSIDVAGDGFQYRKEKATLPIGQLWLAYITRLRRLVWLIWFRCVCSLRWGRGKTRIVVRRSCTCRRWSESRIILRVESGLGIHHSIDSGDDEMKCFVDIFGVFDTHFDEVYVHLLRKFLALLIGDLSLVNQIDFIADKKHPLWRWCNGSHFVIPLFNILKTVQFSDVVKKHNTMCRRNILTHNKVKTFISRGIPNLSCYSFVLIDNICHEKINSDSWNIIIEENILISLLFLNKADKRRALPNAFVTKKEESNVNAWV